MSSWNYKAFAQALKKIVPLPKSYKSEFTCISATDPREVFAKKWLRTNIQRGWDIKLKAMLYLLVHYLFFSFRWLFENLCQI